MRTPGVAQEGRARDSDHSQGKAGQDQGQGRQPWLLRHVPDCVGFRARDLFDSILRLIDDLQRPSPTTA